MKTRKDVMVAMMRLDLARLHGEEISEFRAARVIAEYMLDDYIEMLDRGMPRSAIIEYLAHAACSSRKTAADVLLRVLRKAKYIPKNIESPTPAKRARKSSTTAAKVEIQAEVSLGRASPVTPKPDPVPASTGQAVAPAKVEPAVHVVREVSPASSEFKISAPAECVEKPAESSEEKKPDKWAHLSTDGVVGRGFLGEEHRWMTPEEIQKVKEDLERLHRISNEMSDRRKEIEKAKIQQKEASQTQSETPPDKE